MVQSLKLKDGVLLLITFSCWIHWLFDWVWSGCFSICINVSSSKFSLISKTSISDKVVVELDNECPTAGKDNELVVV
jgi:hypothetical protein